MDEGKIYYAERMLVLETARTRNGAAWRSSEGLVGRVRACWTRPVAGQRLRCDISKDDKVHVISNT